MEATALIAPSGQKSPAAPAAPRPRLWAVGGGKGGVGKSVVTSSLGTAFAASGRRTVLVDADLGAANLHTLLGVEAPSFTLSHFLNGEAKTLEQVICPTAQPNLSLISGARALVGMANPAHARKQKLTRHLEKLDADDVFLDLGAGTAFNVLDFFVAADRGILVVEPEPTSIENSYSFLKAAFFRSLRLVAREPDVRAALELVLADREKRLQSPGELIARVSDLEPEAGRLLREQAEAFSPMLIVNGVRTDDERELGAQIASACRNFLGIQVRLLGSLEWDEVVPRAVRTRRPVRRLSSACPFWKGLEEIANGLIDMETRPASHTRCSQPIHRDEPEAIPDHSLPGVYLKRYRERLGLSLEDARRHTRIRQLGDIEGEFFDRLPPEEIYLKGLVLSYARTLRVPRPEALAIKYMERYRYAQRWTERPPQRVAG